MLLRGEKQKCWVQSRPDSRKELYLHKWMFPPSQNGRSGGRVRFHSAVFGFHSTTLLEILSLPLLWVSSIKFGSSYFIGKHHEKVNHEWYHIFPCNTKRALWEHPEENSFFSSRLRATCDIQKNCINFHQTSSVLYRYKTTTNSKFTSLASCQTDKQHMFAVKCLNSWPHTKHMSKRINSDD